MKNKSIAYIAKYNLTSYIAIYCSTFIAFIKVYPFFYLIYISISLLILIFNNKHYIICRENSIVLISSTFFLLSGIVSFYFNDYNNFEQFCKFLLTISSLIIFILYFQKLSSGINLVTLLNKWAYRIISIILLINFFQLCIVILNLNLINLPFNLKNSADSDIISYYFKFVGDNNKNIWASKIILIFSLAFYLYYERFISNKKFIFLTFISGILIFYLTSRVSQLIYIFILVIFIFKFIRNKFKYLFISVLLIFTTYYFFERVSAVNFFDLTTGHDGDGFKARIFLYNFFIDNVENINFINIIFGNGFVSSVNIQNWMFQENNYHNVFFNIFQDFGLIGIISYLFLIFSIFSRVNKKTIVFFVPFFIVISFQYFGYEPDLIFYLSMVYLFSRLKLTTS